jgi:stage III sporulation protein AF
MIVLKEWIMTIAGAVIILGMIDMILPSGKTKKTVTIVSGFILTAILIMPLFRIVADLKSQTFFDFKGGAVEQDRSEILDNRDMYTEDQLAIIASNYKRKLVEHINSKVEAISGVGKANSTVIIKEDYTQNDFGTLEKIYVSAARGKREDSKTTSKMGEVKRVEKIVIDTGGIRIEKSNDEPPVDQVKKELINEISEELQDEFMIDKTNIIVEIKEG